VLNISSGHRAMAGQAPYRAAKAGMDHFSRALALDEAHRLGGARVASLALGVIDTAMQVQLRGADPTGFPDHAAFIGLTQNGQLTSATEAAARAGLSGPVGDFGTNPVVDVREA
jgi:NAD(P)-dependent dehydrogenase (short-subunit alcohol dehydrogenase family)